MTFDLFDDPEVIGAPAPVPAARPRAEAASYPMQPTGELNRWLYRGVTVVFDNRRERGSALGQWRTVEGVGMPVLHSDERIEVCRAIDARLGGSAST